MKKADLDDGYFKLANALIAALATCKALTELEFRVCMWIICCTYAKRVLLAPGKLRAPKYAHITGYRLAQKMGASAGNIKKALTRLKNKHIIIAPEAGVFGINTDIQKWAGIDPKEYASALAETGYQQWGWNQPLHGGGINPQIGVESTPILALYHIVRGRLDMRT